MTLKSSLRSPERPILCHGHTPPVHSETRSHPLLSPHDIPQPAIRRSSRRGIPDEIVIVRRVSRKNNSCVLLKIDRNLWCDSCRKNVDAKHGRSSYIPRECDLPWILPEIPTCVQVTSHFQLCEKYPELFGRFDDDEIESVKVVAKYWNADDEEYDDEEESDVSLADCCEDEDDPFIHKDLDHFWFFGDKYASMDIINEFNYNFIIPNINDDEYDSYNEISDESDIEYDGDIENEGKYSHRP